MTPFTPQLATALISSYVCFYLSANFLATTNEKDSPKITLALFGALIGVVIFLMALVYAPIWTLIILALFLAYESCIKLGIRK